MLMLLSAFLHFDNHIGFTPEVEGFGLIRLPQFIHTLKILADGKAAVAQRANRSGS
jgi:hypothetical protein